MTFTIWLALTIVLWTALLLTAAVVDPVLADDGCPSGNAGWEPAP
jgi:hypothetical protein